MIELQCMWPTQMVDIFNTHLQCFWEKSSNWTLKTNQVWQWMLTWGNQIHDVKRYFIKIYVLLRSFSMGHWYHGDCPLYLWIIQTQTSIRLMTTGSSKKEEEKQMEKEKSYGGIQDKIVHSIHMYRIDKCVWLMYWVNKYDFGSVMSMEISTPSHDIISHLIALSRLFVTWFCMSTVCAA